MLTPISTNCLFMSYSVFTATLYEWSLNKLVKGAVVVVFFLQHASPHGGQNSCSGGDSEAHLRGWSAVERDGVAFVCWAALDFALKGDAQQRSRCHVDAQRFFLAALSIEPHKAGESRKCWGETETDTIKTLKRCQLFGNITELSVMTPSTLP